MKGWIAGIALVGLAGWLLTGAVSCSDRQQGGTDGRSELSADSLEDTHTWEDTSRVYALLVSPEHPAPGEPFRVLAAGDDALRKARIVFTGVGSGQEIKPIKEGDGSPRWKWLEAVAPGEGSYTVSIEMKGDVLASLEFMVSADQPPASRGPSIWKTGRGWGSDAELLFSAWIGALFRDAEEGTSWKALHEITREPQINFLHNHLGMKEDDPSGNPTVVMEPDCADSPYFLRAYFAWKLGLPFGYHEADRGWLGKAPQTGRWITNETASFHKHPVPAFNAFMRRVMDGVHSGSARTALTNEKTDYYPVPLTRQALRPGVVFADPYGHTFVLVRWIPQTGHRPGTLLAVDAQPDGTVAVKRFWKGNFLFNTSEVVGEPGFKAFRPIALEEGRLRLLANWEIAGLPGVPSFSLEQKGLSADAFYRTMERIISPKPMDPETVLLDLIQALHEQLLTRVLSVANGEEYLRSHPGAVIPMPGSAAGVFLAGGPWEDFSTPNRDLRLLIAMDAILGFPERVMQFPEDYKISKLANVEQVVSDLNQTIARKTADLSITYQRSDGSDWTLTLATILDRREAFEMAYNPNDCIEIRWGAPEGSDERSTGRRQAPPGQRNTMSKVRTWFEQRLHPPT